VTVLLSFQRADDRVRRRPSIRVRFRRSWIKACLAAWLAAAAPICAHAQISGSISLQSQYVVRGYSVSAGKPAALLNLSYDDPSGLYANGSAILDLNAGDNPAFAGGIANVGYAHRLNETVTVDGGLIRTQYEQQNGVKADVGYTEAYFGLVGRAFSTRISYSPAYYKNGAQTVYGELESRRQMWAGVSVGAHIGYLKYTACAVAGQRCTDQYDWRVTASRPIRSVVFFVSISGGGPNHDYYLDQVRSKTVLMGGASWAF
jgi:uncharacterized protein (TIGR02001 family)